MKKINSLFVLAVLLIGGFAFVAAEELDVREAKRVGTFENFFDRMGVAFTFDKEAKIERVLEMAEKRLAEAELLVEEDPEAYEAAQERYDELVAEAEEILAEIAESEDGVNGSVDDLARIARIQNQFEKHREHAGEIYSRALERFELNNASDEKIERFEMFHDRALDRADQMETRILEKRDGSLKNYKDLGELDDDELEDELERIEEREGLKDDREDREERAEIRIQKVVEIKDRNIEKARLKLSDPNLGAEERLEIKNRILEADRNIERFEDRVRERFDDDDSDDNDDSSEKGS